MAWAMSSLPVPDSPRIRTVVLAGAAWDTSSYTRWMAWLLPMRFLNS